MSFYMSMFPSAFAPYMSAFTPAVSSSLPSIAANTVTAANVSAATTSATTTATTASAAISQATTATAASEAFAAFASAALPVAVAIISAYALGLTMDMIHQDRKMKAGAEMDIATVFTDKDTLIRALFAYDKEHECRIYDDPEQQLLTVRFRLQDYYFRMNPERGCYDLHIENAGTCQKMLESVNALQEEYMKAVKTAVVANLYKHIRQNAWSVESDVYDEEDNRVITIEV